MPVLRALAVEAAIDASSTSIVAVTMTEPAVSVRATADTATPAAVASTCLIESISAVP